MSEEFGRVTCGTCGKTIKFPLARFGSVAKCPWCGELLRLVGRSAPPTRRDEAVSVRIGSAGRSRVSAHAGLAVGAIAGVAISAGCFWAWSSMTQDAKQIAIATDPTTGPHAPSLAQSQLQVTPERPTGDLSAVEATESPVDDAAGADKQIDVDPAVAGDPAPSVQPRRRLEPHADHPDIFVADTQYGRLLVRVVSPVVYLLRGSWYYSHDFIAEAAIRRDGEDAVFRNGFCSVRGEAVRIFIDQPSRGIRLHNVDHELNGIYTFTESGSLLINLTVGTEALSLPVLAVEVPFAEGDPAAALVEKYGLPVRKESFSVFWPNTEQVGPIIYSPEAGGPAAIGENWEFADLPGAVFSIQRGAIAEVGSQWPGSE